MIRYLFTRQFLEFAAAGGFAAFLNWLSRIMFSFWMPFSWAIVFAYMVGMATAFTLNRVFIFKNSEKTAMQQARGFIFMNLLSFPIVWFSAIYINSGLLSLGLRSYTEAFAHAIAVTLPTITTFLFYKIFAFRDIPEKK
ncbi:GtrA family protein [Pseudomonas sp. PB106]|uniref:GtrA family protein n=1 Tax=Pseudomonas sp. PB106 TaxID=2494699 RepID=UPI00131AB679|nr:GtrA family protein [Pseudomonas sp. PB106]